MSIDVQLEAMKILKDRQDSEKAYDTTMQIGSIAIDCLIPGAGRLQAGLSWFTKSLCKYCEREYTAELEKAGRGERDTLPEPPPQGDGTWYACS